MADPGDTQCRQSSPSQYIKEWESLPVCSRLLNLFGRRFMSLVGRCLCHVRRSANKLWAENRQNVMSCFVETISDVVKTEALLITHPAETINHVFSTASKSKEEKTLSTSACPSSSSFPAVPSEGVASFKSYGPPLP